MSVFHYQIFISYRTRHCQMPTTFINQLANLLKNESNQIFKQLLSVLQLTYSVISQQLRKQEQQIQQIYFCIQQPKLNNYQQLIHTVKISQADVLHVIEIVCQLMTVLAYDSKKDITGLFQPQVKYHTHKEQILKRKYPFEDKNDQFISQLRKIDTNPTYFVLTSTIPSTQSLPKIQQGMEFQIRQSLNKMINKMDIQIEQFKNVYAYTLNDQQTIEKINLLKNQYSKISKSSLPTKDEVVKVKSVCKNIRYIILEQKKKVKQMETMKMRNLGIGKQNNKY